MERQSLLTPNAILYISLGFNSLSNLQILQLRKGHTQCLQMVVYDGIVYAGAHYDYSAKYKRLNTQQQLEKPSASDQLWEDSNRQKFKLPGRYDVIRVQTILHAKNQPLCILDLEVLQTGLFQILGREIITLEEYMKRRRFLPQVDLEAEEKDDQSSKPTKRHKSNQMILAQFQEPICNDPELPNQGIRGNPETTILHTQVLLKSDDKGVESAGSLKGESEGSNQGGINSESGLAESSIIQQESQIFIAFEQQQVCSQSLKSKGKTQSWKSNNLNSAPEPNPPKQKIQSLISNKPLSQTKPLRHQIQILQQAEDSVQIVQTKCKPKPNTIDLVASQLKASRAASCKKEKVQLEDTMFIRDLYERMHRFRIVCRVNHIENFRSMKGNYCVKMMLVDETGDQIFCILYDKAAERRVNGTLDVLKGRTYIFQNGDVEKDDSGALTLSMPWSGIHQTKLLLNSFHPSKMMRVGQVEGLSADYFMQKFINTNSNSTNPKKALAKQLNVCGIFLGLRDQPKLINGQFKVVGGLCDCDQQRSINFSLFVSELTSFPRQQGVVLSLHNMRAVQSQGTYKLQSTKRSYYLVQNHNEHRYMSDLLEISQSQRWKMLEYRNLSEIVYVTRRIKQLQDIMISLLEGDHSYSEIDCNVVSIIQNKEYQACAVCKKIVKPSVGLAAYCYSCKKIERWATRFLFAAEVADSTSSMEVKFSSDQMEGFVNMGVEDYAKMSQDSRSSVLELSTYQNVVLRVKSEKAIGGSQHYVSKVQRANHTRALKEIKDRSIEDKTKYTSAW